MGLGLNDKQKKHIEWVKELLKDGWTVEEIHSYKQQVGVRPVARCVGKKDFSHYKENKSANGRKYVRLARRALEL